MLGAAGQITRYVRDWPRVHEWDLLGGPDDYVTASGRRMVDEIARPFGEWLASKDLDVVARFAYRTMTAMGYGPLDTVSTLYGLRWNVPSLLWSAVTLKVTEPIPGWQYLWRHLAGRLDVRRNHTITEVERVGGQLRLHFAEQRPRNSTTSCSPGRSTRRRSSTPSPPRSAATSRSTTRTCAGTRT